MTPRAGWGEGRKRTRASRDSCSKPALRGHSKAAARSSPPKQLGAAAVRHLAACALVLGCSELLGIPDNPYVVPRDAAAPSAEESSPLALDAGSSLNPASTPAVTGASAGTDEPLSAGGAPGGADGGSVDETPGAAIRPPGADALPAGGGTPSAFCAPIARASISDFSFTPGSSPTEASFGAGAAFLGGTFYYPAGGTLLSDVTQDDWHLSGTVSGISGFGLYSSACRPFDASGFPGVTFTLWGHIEGDQPLIFFIESAAQQVSYLWANAHEPSPTGAEQPPNSGRCIPASMRYDGTCREPRVSLTLTPEPTTVVLTWADFVGGSPVPTVSSREITSIAWALPPPGSVSYAVDIHIDDLRFVTP